MVRFWYQEIYRVPPSLFAQKKNGNQSGTNILPPEHRCPLRKLDHGMETSISFKRVMAEFADVPVGQDFINKLPGRIYCSSGIWVCTNTWVAKIDI